MRKHSKSGCSAKGSARSICGDGSELKLPHRAMTIWCLAVFPTIILMVVLCRPERTDRQNLRDDWRAFLDQSVFQRSGGLGMIVIVIENDARVLWADVGPLPVCLGWIVIFKEILDEFGKAQRIWIVDHPDRFHMAGLSAAYLFIRGMFERTDRPCGSGPGGLRSRYAALYRTRPIFLLKSRSNPNRRARARHRPTVRERHFLLRWLTTRDRRCAEKHSDPERRASRHADFACPSFLACRGLPSGLLSETRPDAILSSLCAAVLAQSHRRKWNVQNLSRYSRFLNACACGKVRQSASILFHSWAVTGVTDKRLPFCKSCMVLSSGICLKVRSAITSLNVLSHCTSTQYQIGLSGVDLGS